MNGWSDKSKILCIEQSGRAEKNTRKQKFCLSSRSLSKYFPNIFLSPGDSKIFAAVFFQESGQLVPSLYHILQQACQNSNWFLYCWDGVSTRTQIFERKWNCQNMFTQIFLSEIISIAENGGQGTHFLISQILNGLTIVQWLYGQCPNELRYFFVGASLNHSKTRDFKAVSERSIIIWDEAAAAA